MPTVNLLTAAQYAVIIMLSAVVNQVVDYLKPTLEAFIPPSNRFHDQAIRLFVLLFSEAIVFGYVVSQNLLSATSWPGYALGGLIIAGGAILSFHLSNGSSTSAQSPAPQSLDPVAFVQAAIQQLVPPAGVVPPASAAPAPAPAAPVENAVTSNAAAESAPVVASA